MGKICTCRQDSVLDAKAAEAAEEDATQAVERACNHVNDGNFEKALSLLEKAERLDPHAKGLPEIVAVTEVCYAATRSRCPCSLKLSSQRSPEWYQILKVSEKADFSTIKTRYRQLALLLHPDKNKHARAEEAFKLVSEAYAHLADRKQRAIFDLERSKWQCKKCCLTFLSQIDSQNSMKGYKERLKGKNQTNSQRDYFGTKIHSAAWNMEHEKLKVFRERAQEKMESLAQILRERRLRWNEEVETAREKYQSRKHDMKTSLSSVEHRDQQADLFQQLHQGLKARNKVAIEADSSLQRSSHSKISQIIKNQGLSIGAENLIEQVKPSKLKKKETPQILQGLDGLLEILREDFVGNSNNVRKEDHVEANAKMNDNKKFGLDTENRASQSFMKTQWFHGSTQESKVNVKSLDNVDEELSVINAFLAMLSDCLPQNDQISDQNLFHSKFLGSKETKNSKVSKSSMNLHESHCSSVSKSADTYSFDRDFNEPFQQSSPITDMYESGSTLWKGPWQQKLTQKFWKIRESTWSSSSLNASSEKANSAADCASKKYILNSNPSPSAAALVDNKMSHRSFLKANIFQKVPEVPLDHYVHTKSTLSRCENILGGEENSLPTQMKKSEQLLKNLVHLRKEIKSVAAAISEKKKDSVGTESHHVGRMFPGNCHLPFAASMVAT